MRLHRVLDQLFCSRVMTRTIRTLLQSGLTEWTGRELARASACSPPQTIRALNELEKMGLVGKRVVGRSHVWTLDQEHVLVEALRPLFAFEVELPTKFQLDIKQALRRLPVRTATLFGSVARGAETDQSDADLYIQLSPRASEEEVQAALTPIIIRFIRRYGTVISPLIHAPPESAEPRNAHLLRTIRGEGVPIIGGPP